MEADYEYHLAFWEAVKSGFYEKQNKEFLDEMEKEQGHWQWLDDIAEPEKVTDPYIDIEPFAQKGQKDKKGEK